MISLAVFTIVTIRGGAQLRIELETFDGDKVFAHYNHFEVRIKK